VERERVFFKKSPRFHARAERERESKIKAEAVSVEKKEDPFELLDSFFFFVCFFSWEEKNAR
jgi:hypothetical protein